jgi:cob(I)alamin adenosyltransferase
MPVPNRPTTGQKATITRGLNLQAATKKDIQLLEKRIDSLEKQLSKSQKEILRAIKKSAKRWRAK